MYIIYKENDAGERFFYGSYESRKRANEIAIDLNDLGNGYDYCVCPEDEAADFGVIYRNYKSF